MCGWNAGVEGADKHPLSASRDTYHKRIGRLEAAPHEVSPRPETHMESAGFARPNGGTTPIAHSAVRFCIQRGQTDDA